MKALAYDEFVKIISIDCLARHKPALPAGLSVRWGSGLYARGQGSFLL